MRVFIAILSLIYVTSTGCISRSQHERPNVIIILTDDQGYGEIGANGNEFIRTPNLDAFYHEGVHLEDFHANNVCSPSRAAIMTGKYSTAVGVWHTLGGKSILNIDETTMAEVFMQNNYRTYMIGKWHLGDNYPYRPEDRGFEEVFRIGGGSLGQIADYWGNGLWDGHYWNGNDWIPTEGYCTDVQFDAAMDFIDGSREDPFFLYLATTAPHSPIGAAPEYVEPYLEMGFSKEVANFYGMVTNIDENVGRLRSFLEKKGISKNTILIFMSDNGSACAKKDSSIFNDGMRGKKGSDYEGGHRVPCFIYWPDGNITGGRSITELTAHIDLLPTLSKACELVLADELSVDGKNILPLLQGEDVNWTSRFIVTEGKVNNRESLFKSSCVMSDNWRLVSGNELYDVKIDPGQKESVETHEVYSELRENYMEWHASVSSVFNEEYWFQILDSTSATPFVTMDLLPIEGQRKYKSVWNQSAVKKGVPDSGCWNIEFLNQGKYTFKLRRFPLEADANDIAQFSASQPEITTASVRMNGIEVGNTEELFNGEASVLLYIEPGKYKVEANFTSVKGDVFSAYYMYISEQIGEK